LLAVGRLIVIGVVSIAICSNLDRKLETAGNAPESISGCSGDAIVPNPLDDWGVYDLRQVSRLNFAAQRRG
jgi:hypothetical protein